MNPFRKFWTFAFFITLFTLSSNAFSQPFTKEEIKALAKQASEIEIVKDTYGVPHVYAKTDAGAVFGMMYVQCEEFFEKVEQTLISRTGRSAEVEGEASISKDLWTRMFTDSTKAVALYNQSPEWLRKLCDAHAAGINYYMITHPTVKPKLIKRAQPWMSLMNNVAPMGGSNVAEADFKAFYLIDQPTEGRSFNSESSMYDGSNGWALAPSRTQSKHAILLINPHSDYYGRIEIQLVSDEGLNSYGAPFLGQFNIFQGFNEFLGWMHPITLSDAKDLYSELIHKKHNKLYYRYDDKWKPVDSTSITIKYKKDKEILSKTFTTYRTHHGPVVYGNAGRWITLKTYEPNIDLLGMHWLKMKARNVKEFKEVLNTRAMVGNNIIYADKEGNIGYWHGNFVPKRNPLLDWKRPVDGTTSSTEWQGTHTIDEIPHYFNPANGWVQNCNSTPLYGAGYLDTVMMKLPAYMLPDGHTPRAAHALKVLTPLRNATMDDVVKASYDNYLPSGERFTPPLIRAYEANATDSMKIKLSGAIYELKKWNYKADTTSIATTLSVLWLEKIIQLNIKKLPQPITTEEQYTLTNGAAMSTEFVTPQEQLKLFSDVINDLEKDFKTWKVTWGMMNRFQRSADGKFSDEKPSKAVPATPGFMGSINAYAGIKGPETKGRYGVNGNTFVAAVEFGDKLRAKTILTGGASSDPNSKHFRDQIDGYIHGTFKEIFFYKKDVYDHAEKVYKPGK